MVSEVILVDGHSTDETIAVAQRLLPTIRVIKQKGRGKGDALKIGFTACTGDIIVMLDADGWQTPTKYRFFLKHCWRATILPKARVFCKAEEVTISPCCVAWETTD